MKKSIFATFIFTLLLNACATNKKGPLVSYKDTDIDGKTVSSAVLTNPLNIAQFSDIPVPEGAMMNTDNTVIMGSGDAWIGRLIYSAPYAANAIFGFYLSEMPKFGWTEITVVRGKVNQMIYQQGMRIANIQIEEDGTNSSEVFFMVSPPSRTTPANNPSIPGEKIPRAKK